MPRKKLTIRRKKITIKRPKLTITKKQVKVKPKVKPFMMQPPKKTRKQKIYIS